MAVKGLGRLVLIVGLSTSLKLMLYDFGRPFYCAFKLVFLRMSLADVLDSLISCTPSVCLTALGVPA